jgi:hypothetical protein
VDTTTVATTAPPTTPPSTTPPPTTRAPTTTLTDDELKAQIAADYMRSSELLDELASNPTLDGLDERLAQIAAPGSVAAEDLRAFIVGMVERGERVINGAPDYSTVEVESVEFVGATPYIEATVTYCLVTNRIRIDSAGMPQPGTGGLIASREFQTVQPTPNGWLPSSRITEIWGEVGASECPPA